MVRLLDPDAGAPGNWRIVNDGVMGGRSSSSFTMAPAHAVFEGHLSLANGGGFASVRIAVEEGALAGAGRVRLRVRGDGRCYELRLRRGHRFTEVAWTASFRPPDGAWTTVEIPLAAFEPTFRGSRPRGVGPPDPGDIGQIGFMLSDGREGPFRLEVAWVEAEEG
jgi:monofunctional biosynthetic peptidoglycan transglycosylase